MLSQVQDLLNVSLVKEFGEDLELEFDEDSIQALEPRRKTTWDKVQNADFLSTNEKREAVGYEPVEGGDDIGANAPKPDMQDQTDQQDAESDPPPEEDQGKSIEVKKFNLITPSQKKTYWKWANELRKRYASQMEDDVADLLRKQAEDIESTVGISSVSNADKAVDYAIQKDRKSTRLNSSHRT